jgi:carboxypeptidase Taq
VTVNEAYDELKRRLGEISDLQGAAGVLAWDQLVMMPPGGAGVRAERLATLARLAHEKFVDDEIGSLLEGLRGLEEELPFDSDEASLIRVTRRDWEKRRRVPPELTAEMARHASQADKAWVEARAASDYAAFQPWLAKTFELKRRYVDCFEGADDPYDVLLDDFEPGLTAATVQRVFDRLKETLVPLIRSAPEPAEEEFLAGPFDVNVQRDLSLGVLEHLGFTREEWRLDATVHPFCSGFATSDIRLTTRYAPDDLQDSFFGTIHEFGHGIYENGVSPALERTPLGAGASMTMHESQSRLWENLVGRSVPFWRWAYPQVQGAFPDVLRNVEPGRFLTAVNQVRPSFIRVDADETTYGMHIVTRFELERELLAGSVSLDELPEAWNARYAEYLGVQVPEDRVGVLQDIHWSGGMVGYFPSYQLGNVVSVQIWEKVREALPDLDEQLEQGEFAGLREWLREHVYRHGRKFTTTELLERLVGGGIDPEPYLAYLRGKFEAPAPA